MDQHPVPRQITTFEFKLIGFFTVKQFIYIIVFAPIGFVVYSLFPIPLLNIVLGVLIGSIGFVIALVPINDRPIDVWFKNLVKRLTSPTQYVYHKSNQPVYFFNHLYFVSDPHRVMSHIESQEKLAAYLNQTQQVVPAIDEHKKRINDLFRKHGNKPSIPTTTQADTAQPVVPTKTSITVPVPQPLPPSAHATPLSLPVPTTQESIKPVIKKSERPAVVSPKQPFFTGVVKNHRLIPIPGILIYVKDANSQTMRLLKSNPHGVFATFNPLAPGEYTLEMKDPRNGYFFDTMKITINDSNPTPFEVYSKELL